jgi:hypothetical protein
MRKIVGVRHGVETAMQSLLKRLEGCFRDGRPQGVDGQGMAGPSDTFESPLPPLAIRPCWNKRKMLCLQRGRRKPGCGWTLAWWRARSWRRLASTTRVSKPEAKTHRQPRKCQSQNYRQNRYPSFFLHDCPLKMIKFYMLQEHEGPEKTKISIVVWLTKVDGLWIHIGLVNPFMAYLSFP